MREGRGGGGERSLKGLQRQFFEAVTRPLDANDRARRVWSDGRKAEAVVGALVTATERMTALERVELYNRQYWFRVWESFLEDFPGVRWLVGERRFERVMRAYLEKHPSRTFTLRNLGAEFAQFLDERGATLGLRSGAAADMARLEWAQIEAFDAEDAPVLDGSDLAGGNALGLRFGLHPSVRLLSLGWRVDAALMSMRKDQMRNDASHAVHEPRGSRRRTVVRRPRAGSVEVVVFRWKERTHLRTVDPGAMRILRAIEGGAALGEALEAGIDPEHDDADEYAGRVQRWFREAAEAGWLTPQRTKRGKATGSR